MKNRIIIITLFLMTPALADPKDFVDTRMAQKIANKKGVLKPTEVLKWEAPKEIPKGWIELDNKYFSVSFPNCFVIEAEGGEDDTKIAPFINFKRTENCPSFVKNYEESNSFNINYNSLKNLKSIDKAFSGDYLLIKQKISLDGKDGLILGGLRDDYNLKTTSYTTQFRWKIFVICEKKLFEIISTVPPGEPSMELVNKNNYSIPEDFKEIISTFKCKDEEKLKRTKKNGK